MLKKLLKYDLKNVFKILVIFYSLSLFFGILTRLFLSVENSFVINIIGKICSGVSISMMFNILINNLMRLWADFKQDLYDDKSYLTHTLPVEKKTLYLSKISSAVISSFVSVFVIGLTLFIAYYSKENIIILKNLLLPLVNMYNSSLMNILLIFLFIFFLEYANILQVGYTGMILGHKMNNIKVVFSIIYGFITYLATQTFVLFITFILALFNKDIMNLFFTNQIINLSVIKVIMYVMIFVYVILLIVGYIINVKLLKKGVNVN